MSPLNITIEPSFQALYRVMFKSLRHVVRLSRWTQGVELLLKTDHWALGCITTTLHLELLVGAPYYPNTASWHIVGSQFGLQKGRWQHRDSSPRSHWTLPSYPIGCMTGILVRSISSHRTLWIEASRATPTSSPISTLDVSATPRQLIFLNWNTVNFYWGPPFCVALNRNYATKPVLQTGVIIWNQSNECISYGPITQNYHTIDRFVSSLIPPPKWVLLLNRPPNPSPKKSADSQTSRNLWQTSSNPEAGAVECWATWEKFAFEAWKNPAWMFLEVRKRFVNGL